MTYVFASSVFHFSAIMAKRKMIYYSETDTNILKESVNNYLGVIECIHNIENVEKGL